MCLRAQWLIRACVFGYLFLIYNIDRVAAFSAYSFAIFNCHAIFKVWNVCIGPTILSSLSGKVPCKTHYPMIRGEFVFPGHVSSHLLSILNSIFIVQYIIEYHIYNAIVLCSEIPAASVRFPPSAAKSPVAYYEPEWSHDYTSSTWVCFSKYIHTISF